MPGDVTKSEWITTSYWLFQCEIGPKILAVARGDKVMLGDLFDTYVIERYTSLAWEHETLERALFSNGMLPPGQGMVTAGILNATNRTEFVSTVFQTLQWYVHEAATILGTSLHPPEGLWDLSFTGDEFILQPDVLSRSPRPPPGPAVLDDLLEEEEAGVLRTWDEPRAPRPVGGQPSAVTAPGPPILGLLWYDRRGNPTIP